jgi:small subunit ribosomal protein S4e
MAKMGSRKHLKRYKAPKSWPIHPKENTWTVKPAPGTHSIKDSLSLLVIVRDILGVADNARESKRLINTGNLLVDGRAKKDYKFPVGFMDILSIPRIEENYRILLDTKGRLTLHPVSAEDAEYKLAKIMNKSQVKGGKTQLHLHDGRNVLVDEDEYSTYDVISLSIPEQEIKDTYKFEEGATILVTGGKHTGEIG